MSDKPARDEKPASGGKKRGLGRGLAALIRDTDVETTGHGDASVDAVPLDSITFNPLQPRQSFSQGSLEELTQSILQHGVLQPLLVRRRDDHHELIAGERRLRAARAAKLERVPIIVVDADDSEALALALIENLQREDLTVLEEAHAYQVLTDQFGLTQEQVALRVGKARATVANAMRMAGLPDDVKALIASGDLSTGHAKVLAGLSSVTEQMFLAQRVASEGMTVRALEKLAEKSRRVPRKPRVKKPDIPDAHLAHILDALHKFFGTRVRVTPSVTLANGKKRKGSIEIDFYSNEELDRILDLLGLTES